MAKAKRDLDAPFPLPPGVPADGAVKLNDEAGAPKPPPFGTAVPAGPGTLPRVVDPLARAGDGEQRFKVRCNNYQPRKIRYVLAAEGDVEGAKACYLAAESLDKEIARLKKVMGDKAGQVEEPDLVVTVLED